MFRIRELDAPSRSRGRARAVLLASFLAAGCAGAMNLDVQRDTFVLGRDARFLFMVSYFDALDAPGAALEEDLAYLKRTVRADGIRIFPNWWDSCGKTSCAPVPTRCNETGRRCTLMDANGNLNASRLARLEHVLQRAGAYGLVVDVSFAAETVGPGELDPAEYRSGLRAATSALRGHPHVIVDLQNEWTHVGLFEESDIGPLVTELRQVDPTRLFAASVEQSRTPRYAAEATVRQDLDMTAYHDPRVLEDPRPWHERTAEVVATLLRHAPGRPAYLQEPMNWADDPVPLHHRRAIRLARTAGAGAWTFHTESTFVLDAVGYRSKLDRDPAERDTLESLSRCADTSRAIGDECGVPAGTQ